MAMAARARALVPLAVFAGLALALAVGLKLDPRTIPSALIGREVPQFALPPLGNTEGFSTQDLHLGKPVLVNVFASWCVPCRQEQPLLMRLAAMNVAPIYGLNYKDRPEDALAFLSESGNPFSRIGVDRAGRVAIDWGVYGVPESYVVDGQGRIVLKHVGPLTPDVLAQKILPALRGERS